MILHHFMITDQCSSCVAPQLNFARLVRARCNGDFVAASSCLMTRLLFDSCGGNGRTALIATISSLQRDLKATLHTLHVARQAMSVNERPRFNFACRRDSPRGPKGKSRAGQSISLVHRFTRAARGYVTSHSRAVEDPKLAMWKCGKP